MCIIGGKVTKTRLFFFKTSSHFLLGVLFTNNTNINTNIHQKLLHISLYVL